MHYKANKVIRRERTEILRHKWIDGWMDEMKPNHRQNSLEDRNEEIW